MSSELYDIYSNVVSKGHQNRACVVCKMPVTDHTAVPLNIGGGLEVLVHRTCMNELNDAMQPQVVTIPVPASVSKPVRKSTVEQPFDKDTMLERTKYEFGLLLIKHGLI